MSERLICTLLPICMSSGLGNSPRHLAPRLLKRGRLTSATLASRPLVLEYRNLAHRVAEVAPQGSFGGEPEGLDGAFQPLEQIGGHQRLKAALAVRTA
jgi:hypothetical protein